MPTASSSSLLLLFPLVGFSGAPLARPVLRIRFRALQGFGIFIAGRHRRRGPREHLMMVYVEQAQPALLPHGERDEAAKLHQLGLAVVPMHALPERVVG